MICDCNKCIALMVETVRHVPTRDCRIMTDSGALCRKFTVDVSDRQTDRRTADIITVYVWRG